VSRPQTRYIHCLFDALAKYLVHRMAIVTFWRIFHHDGKICPDWLEWGVHTHPLSPYPYHHVQSCSVRSSGKGSCTLPISTITLHVLCDLVPLNRVETKMFIFLSLRKQKTVSKMATIFVLHFIRRMRDISFLNRINRYSEKIEVFENAKLWTCECTLSATVWILSSNLRENVWFKKCSHFTISISFQG
jgi:hypothetical protein